MIIVTSSGANYKVLFSPSQVDKMSSEAEEDCGGGGGGGQRSEVRRRRTMICSIFLLCCAGALQGILVNGLINVVITTIEKR